MVMSMNVRLLRCCGTHTASAMSFPRIAGKDGEGERLITPLGDSRKNERQPKGEMLQLQELSCCMVFALL